MIKLFVQDNSFTNFLLYKTEKLIHISEAKKTNILFKKGALLYIKESKNKLYSYGIFLLFITFSLFLNELLINLSVYKIINFDNDLISTLSYFHIFDAVYLLIIILLFYFIIQMYIKNKKMKNNFNEWLTYFEYDESELYLSGETESKSDENKPLYHLFDNNKKFLMNMLSVKAFIINSKSALPIFYFLIFGYHFKELSNGNVIYKDLYQAFLFYKDRENI
ncbi:hypothetical protein ACR82Z_03630 [Mycoplasma sp. 6243]|uniref:hypothetical protein n=1 Tax=Mycoplasma sp. 6243 TaxID=3440865 RepID=UPI003EBE4309